MSDIIFHNIIEKFNTSANNINSYFGNQDYYNTNIYDIIHKMPKYNIIIYIFIIFLIYSFVTKLTIRLNEILIFLICVVLIYFLIIKDYTQFIEYTQQKKSQLNFLHKLMFNTPNKKSYLYLNPNLVDFFYNMRQYSQFNISAYVNTLIHCNNLLKLEYQANLGLNNAYANYQVAVVEKNSALNEFNSIIYSLPSTKFSYKQFDKSTTILHKLLNNHILNMSNLSKNKDINMDEMPNNFYEDKNIIKANDIYTKDYISVFNAY